MTPEQQASREKVDELHAKLDAILAKQRKAGVLGVKRAKVT
jgi:hypothetical protein